MKPILRFFIAAIIFFIPTVSYGLSVPYQISGTAIDFQGGSAPDGIEIAIDGHASLSDALVDASSEVGFSRWDYEIVAFTMTVSEYTITGSGTMWFSYSDGGLELDGLTSSNTPWSLSDYSDEALFGPELPNQFQLFVSPYVFNHDFAPDNIIDISMRRLPLPVPEPSSLVLLGLGLLLLCWTYVKRTGGYAKTL